MQKLFHNSAACSTSVVAAEADSLPGVSANKPNGIFSKTDDQRFDSLSMTGHPVTKTPNIDPLVTEGVFFNEHTHNHVFNPHPISIFGKVVSKNDDLTNR